MTTLTWNRVPPTRPVLADFQTGGVPFANDDRYPPPTDPSNPGTGKFPTANWANQLGGQFAAFGRVCFSLVVDIDYHSTTPYVVRAVTPGAWLDALNPYPIGSDSPLTVTESAAGDLSVFWPAASLPSGTSLVHPPMLGVHGSSPARITFGGFFSSPPNVGIRVLTWSNAPAGIRVPFTMAFVL